MKTPETLFQKIWNRHVVTQEPGSPAVLYIDLHLVHEVTSPQAFAGLASRGIKVRRTDKTVATIDHSIPTLTDGSARGRLAFADEECKKQILQLEKNCDQFGIRLNGLDSDGQGVVHIIGPEQGYTQPGMTIVCGDSHTATHGAFGALAFGIGTSEVEHVLATQCILQNRPKNAEVRIDGELGRGVTAKDVILALIQKIGVGGGTGYVLEYTGSVMQEMDMEERMTVCNMSIEAGARAGMVAPDETTFKYLAGKPAAPKGAQWEKAVAQWKQLSTDPGAVYDQIFTLDGSQISPMITFGTNPGMGIPVDGVIPSPDQVKDPGQKEALIKALVYMNMEAGTPIQGKHVDVVFVGSCTNGRLSDLRQAAKVMAGKRVARGVKMLVVPGSQIVKRQAESEGLDRVFIDAGAEWREPGCSLCIAMNGDHLEPGQVAVSTSNRNFEGRQGRGGRTLLASPLTAAAAAVTGRVTDPRTLI